MNLANIYICLLYMARTGAIVSWWTADGQVHVFFVRKKRHQSRTFPKAQASSTSKQGKDVNVGYSIWCEGGVAAITTYRCTLFLFFYFVCPIPQDHGKTNDLHPSYEAYATLEAVRDLKESVCRMPEGAFNEGQWPSLALCTERG